MGNRKNHFVLVELSDYDNYPALIPIRDFFQAKGGTPTSREAGDELIRKKYKKLESSDNIIYIPPSFR